MSHGVSLCVCAPPGSCTLSVVARVSPHGTVPWYLSFVRLHLTEFVGARVRQRYQVPLCECSPFLPFHGARILASRLGSPALACEPSKVGLLLLPRELLASAQHRGDVAVGSNHGSKVAERVFM